MKRLGQKIICFLSIMIILLNVSSVVLATVSDEIDYFKVGLETQKQTLNLSEEFEISVNIKDIQNIERGIIVLGGQLEYDINVLQIVDMQAQNEWSLTDGFNEGNFKFVTDNNAFITENATIFKIKFKIKDNITEPTKTTIKIKNIEASNGKIDIPAEEAILELNIVKEEKTYITSEKYDVQNEEKIIAKILPQTTLKDFLANVESNKIITVTDTEGNQISEETIIGTGMILRVGELEFALVVTGDLNGDGEITLVDIAKIKLHLIEKEILTGLYYKASDVNYSNDITITDLAKMKLVYIGASVIE